ncbi:TetR/AcrR family transcriptional regulator [Microlunatus soli]|uniref:Regulatory protein, tetR family n=1 Tax=Microlunatus soli TaxID=630515 RepID=A0A1H1U818_9ACTN|nr:TetR/AcrR family transcriptional regulator [Microlunatus soli]SDS68638.1 regulatory protein, tetR family [Microlunatus soli]
MTEAADEGLPRAVAIAWGMVADPQRGPKRELSHERIVEAAIEIADADGLGAVTMSKVASSLGFTTMALYRYVTAKEDLLHLMQEAVTADRLTAPETDLMPPADDDGERSGWQRELRLIADQLYAMYREHPWLTDIPVSSAQLLTPNNLLVADQAIRAMRTLPITDHEKVGVLLLISTFVRSAAELARDMADEYQQLSATAVARRVEIVKELVSPERFPYLRPLVDSGAYIVEMEDPPDDDTSDYEFGIHVIIAGVAQYADGREPVASAVADPGIRTEDQLAEAMGLDHVRKDAKVRDAVKKRREAETKLREARKRERELIKAALERGAK